MTLWKHEIKMNYKSLLVWSGCVGLICFGCLWLFEGLAGTMGRMSGLYANLGKFSAAFGMDRLAIGTIEGYYAAEIALIFSVGGAMFAAMTGAVMLSKEEEGHTSEFLNTLPLGRTYIVLCKYLAMTAVILGFQTVCMIWELAGFAVTGEMPGLREYVLYHAVQFLMQEEMGSICFVISSASRKKQTGAALGLAVLLYLADMSCRILPALKNLKYLTPFYYSNASDIFYYGRADGRMLLIHILLLAGMVFGAVLIYERRDLAG